MRRLFVTERDLNIQLKDNYTSASVNNASIALLSATFAIKYFNLWEDAFFNLFSQATGKVEKQIVFNSGFWTPKRFRDTFNAQAHGIASLDDMHKLQQAHQENAEPDHVPKSVKLTVEHKDEKQALIIAGVGVIIGIIWFFKR